MGFFDFLKGGSSKSNSGGSQTTYEQRDMLEPYKIEVASPLSKFLASRVGTGIGEYPMDPNYTNRYSEYMSMNPSDYYQKNVAEPAMKLYKEDVLPVVREGYAGNLRGSGRFSEEEAGLNRFSLGLAQGAAEFVPKFHASQLDAGQRMFETQYKNWYNSLAETNPILQSAVSFLGTSSYRSKTIQDIGSSSSSSGSNWWNELLRIGAVAAGTYFGGPMGGEVAGNVYDQAFNG